MQVKTRIVLEFNGAPFSDLNFSNLEDSNQQEKLIGDLMIALEEKKLEITEFGFDTEKDGRPIQKGDSLFPSTHVSIIKLKEVRDE